MTVFCCQCIAMRQALVVDGVVRCPCGSTEVIKMPERDR